MEKYSALMSLYTKEKPEYLNQALESMVKQSLAPDEIVIVMDGEISQQLQSILTKYSKQYPGLLKIVGYEQNKGLGFALNYGLNHCRNDLVARMDTDDISDKERCRKQVAVFSAYQNMRLWAHMWMSFMEHRTILQDVVWFRTLCWIYIILEKEEVPLIIQQ